MSLSDVEASVEALVQPTSFHPKILQSLELENLWVVKYTAAKYLDSILTSQKLYASETAGHTWGDAVYVAPIACPRATMMYGAVGIVGTRPIGDARFFDATDATAIQLYQQWISYMRPLFLQLTTTVHANEANRKLRNLFRGRFRIDCVIFSPDEPCPNYVDHDDIWIALTHWGPTGEVAYGPTSIVEDLRWCVIGTDAFQPEGFGYKALIYPDSSWGKTFVRSGYASLAANLLSAYRAADQVIVTEFYP